MGLNWVGAARVQVAHLVVALVAPALEALLLGTDNPALQIVVVGVALVAVAMEVQVRKPGAMAVRVL